MKSYQIMDEIKWMKSYKPKNNRKTSPLLPSAEYFKIKEDHFQHNYCRYQLQAI